LVPTVTLNNTADEKNTTNGLFAYHHNLSMSNKSINITFYYSKANKLSYAINFNIRFSLMKFMKNILMILF
jgi:hypothetical protein